MDKLHMETPDLTQKNIEKIGELFPEVITEVRDENGQLRHGVNFELLKQLLSDVPSDNNESYEFTWVGKNASIVEANKPIRKTLRPCKKESKNWDSTQNVYIEGDNLDALKIMQESYLGKVKMIYIDPPYNTGHDFIYHDHFEMDKDEFNEQTGLFDEQGNKNFKENNDSNPRFHSDWCSMMFPRLTLARNLLTEDGMIFVSIDYNEVSNLKKMMDQIFGEDNFQREIIWRIGWLSGYKTTASNFIRNHDTILFYSRNNSKMFFSKKYIENKDFKPLLKKDNSLINKLSTLGLNAMQQNELLKFINYDNRPERYPLEDTWNANEYDDLNSIAIVSFSGEKISKILNLDQDFKGQKSVKMLKRLIESTTEDNDIILDFFSGTSSTAEAVMQVNAEDAGCRKFIMVQLQEECSEESEAFKAGYANLCEIGKERIRYVGEKIKSKFPIFANDLDVGFRVFKVDDSNMKDVYYSAGEYSKDLLKNCVSNIKNDRMDLDLLYSCLLDWGVHEALSLPYKCEKIDGFDVHTVNDGDLVACFSKDVSEKVIREIAKRKPLRAVFRDSSFSTSPEKINVTEIFKLLSPDTTVKVI